ncbi:MAG: hypothetical protein Tsb0026_20010 [Sulfuricaulis sp.]
MFEFLKVVGAILGVIAFFWKLKDEYESYVNLEVVATEENDKYISVKVSMRNHSPRRKKIDNAVLLISPEKDDPIDVFNKLLGNDDSNKIVSTRGIAVNCLESPIIGEGGRALIPLPFFYKEQEEIGDECVTYRTNISTSSLEKMEPYSVRFYVWGVGRSHRASQDSFILSK